MMPTPARIAYFGAQFALLAVLIAVYPARFIELHTHWITPADLDMGYLLLAASLYFSYQALGQISAIKPKLLFLVAFALLGFAFLTSQILDIKALFFLTLMASLLSMAGLLFGLEGVKKLIVPIAILNMAMPYWYLAIKPLQAMTVKASNTVVEWASLTVYIEGNYINVPTGLVHIAGGCSGLKYFLTALSISFIASAWNRETLKLTLRNLLIFGSVAIVANWIRVIILVFTAYYEGIDHPWMADHDALGWWVFGFMMLPVFYFTQRQTAEIRDQATLSEANSKSAFYASASVLFALCLVFVPRALLWGEQSAEVPSVEVPEQLENHLIPLASALHKNWRPAYDEAGSETHAHYLLDSKPVTISLLRYPHGGEGELAKTTNTVFDEHWRTISDQKWQDDNGIKLRIASGIRGSKQRTVYYWYQHGNTMHNTILGSKLALLNALWNGENYADLIAISIPCEQDCGVAPDAIEGMINIVTTLKGASPVN